MSLGELICLGLDAVIVTIVYKYYKDTSRNLNALKDAPTFEISHDLKSEVGKCARECIPYAIVRGSVKAIGQPIISNNVPQMAGVIHESILREHKIQWSWASRWWREVKNELSRMTNSVPFALSSDSGDVIVEVLDASSATGLELKTIFDEFKPSEASFWNSLTRFFIGETTTGFQRIETMLPEGSVLTGVGALVLQRGRLCLQAPDGGMRFYLTEMNKDTLLKSLERDASTLKTLAVLFGAFGGLILTAILYKYYDRWREQKARSAELRRVADMIAEQNRQRQERGDLHEQASENVCVVCQENPREVLILECGHICCCLRCGQLLQPAQCPVCRGPISRLVPAFVS